MEKTIKIAITGGIGSGKSLATTALKEAGYFTLSSDAIVSELYEKLEVRQILKGIFPTAVGDAPDFLIDRKAVAKITFSNKEKHKELKTNKKVSTIYCNKCGKYKTVSKYWLNHE